MSVFNPFPPQIADLEDRCTEGVALLHVAQEEVRGLRKKHKPSVIRQNYAPVSPYLPTGSLAMELEDSLRRDPSSEFSYPQQEYSSPQEQRRYVCVLGSWTWIVDSSTVPVSIDVLSWVSTLPNEKADKKAGMHASARRNAH